MMNNELYEKLTRLQWLLHKQQLRCMAEKGPMADTTRGQGRILAMLKMRDGISTKDMSYLLGVRVSSLNELLSKLEKSGYITREPSEQDKRVMLVKLTDKGRNVQQPESIDFNDIFACLSEEEQETLGEYLDRIIAALHTSVGDDEEDWLEKMASLRERLGDIGAFFGSRGREFFEGNGFPHGMHMDFGFDLFRRGDSQGQRGSSDHGKKDDN